MKTIKLILILIILVAPARIMAAWPGECQFVTVSYITENLPCAAYTSYIEGIEVDQGNGYLAASGGYPVCYDPSDFTISRITFNSYYYNGTGWVSVNSKTYSYKDTVVTNFEYGEELPENCEVTPPAECPQSKVDEAQEECADKGGVVWEPQSGEFPTCTYDCANDDCEDERNELEEMCAGGIASFNYDTCEGECVDCTEQLERVEEYCRDYGGIYFAECKIENSSYPGEQDFTVAYTCNGLPDGEDPEESPQPPEETADGTEPETPPDPLETQPDIPAPNDPTKTAEENTANNTQSSAVNTSTAVIQNNTQIGQLSDITGNTKNIADNQGKIQDEVRHVADVNQQGFANVTSAINGMSTNSTSIGTQNNDFSTGIDSVDFSPLASTGTSPTLNGDEFDGELPTDTDYTQYDDNTTLAGEQATAYLESNPALSPETAMPINAQITASGDPCLNGTVTLASKTVPVSICFNKPWMLQGYAIMKIIFIALGYLQTAILLNKGIAS